MDVKAKYLSKSFDSVDDGIVVGDNCYQPVTHNISADVAFEEAVAICGDMKGILAEHENETEDEKSKVIIDKTFWYKHDLYS